MQVCSTDLDQFSIANTVDASGANAGNAKSMVGTECLTGAGAAGSTDFSGDYIEIDG